MEAKKGMLPYGNIGHSKGQKGTIFHSFFLVLWVIVDETGMAFVSAQTNIALWASLSSVALTLETPALRSSYGIVPINNEKTIITNL